MEQWFDVFRFCRCLKQLGKVMVLVVLACTGVVYYAVVFLRYGPQVIEGSTAGSKIGGVAAVLAFSALVGMLLWCYAVAVFTDPGRVPDGWMPFEDEADAVTELERQRHVHHDIKLAGVPRPRYCRKCRAWKPDRTHHDSVTGRCVLKMDHYCIWIINCVGLLNYKAFLLFLVYTCLACWLAAVLLAPSCVRFILDKPDAGRKPAVAFVAAVLAIAFSLSLLGFVVMHARMVAANCTTIEMYEKRRIAVWPYNRGFRRNLMEVFGPEPWQWLVPTLTTAHRNALLDAALQPLRRDYSDV